MLDALTPPRQRLLAGVGLLAAVVAVVVLVVLVTHRSPARTTGSPRADPRPPVVLVPGYGGATAGLSVLATALRTNGRFVRLVDLGTSSLADLHVQAGLVDAAVRDTMADTGAKKVDIVAFSAGGVAVRLWAIDHGGAAIARRIVTLSSPQHGTEVSPAVSGLGPAGCPAACHQLVVQSSLMKSLAEHDQAPAGPDWVSIWTDQDEVVVPPTSAKLDGALNFSAQSVCPGLTVAHPDMPGNPVVIAMVLRELGTAAPAVPGSSVCDARRPAVSAPSG